MNLWAEIVYILCTITSLVCAVLLMRARRSGGPRLLMWSALAFALLCVNNIMLFLDIIVFGNSVDLSVFRLLPALAGVALLCYGFIEEEA